MAPDPLGRCLCAQARPRKAGAVLPPVTIECPHCLGIIDLVDTIPPEAWDAIEPEGRDGGSARPPIGHPGGTRAQDGGDSGQAGRYRPTRMGRA